MNPILLAILSALETALASPEVKAWVISMLKTVDATATSAVEKFIIEKVIIPYLGG